MTDKELRKLKRSKLLELIQYMQKEVEALRSENTNLNKQLDALLENNNAPLDSEPEAETAVITNE